MFRSDGSASPARTVVGLDVLRLCAALLVIGYHFFFWSWTEPAGTADIHDAIAVSLPYPEMVSAASWGWIGVELFFVISGFVITMSAAGKSPIAFAIGRATRLLPGLFVFATLALLVVVKNDLLPWDEATLRWAKSITLFPKGPWIDGVVWTLTVELVFYGLIFLLLAISDMKKLPGYMRAFATVLSLFWLLAFVNHFIVDLGLAGRGLDTLVAAYKSRVVMLTTGSFFLVGMFAHEAFEKGMTRERAIWLGLMLLCSCEALYFKAAHEPETMLFRSDPAVPVVAWLIGCGLCGLSLVYERGKTPNMIWRKRARTVGMLTYPLYLVHNITGGWMLGRFYDAGFGRWGAASAALLMCVSISYAFSLYLEPGMRRALGRLLTPATPQPQRTGARRR